MRTRYLPASLALLLAPSGADAAPARPVKAPARPAKTAPATKRPAPRPKTPPKKTAPPADKAAPDAGRSGLGFLVGGAWLAVADKLVVGPSFGMRMGHFGLDIELGFGFATSEQSQKSLNGDAFWGIFSGAHVIGVPLRIRPVELELGTGMDAWVVSAIDSKDPKLAWPVLAGVRVALGEHLSAAAHARYYLLSSDGLEVGESYDGQASFPVILSVSFGGKW